MRVRLRGGRRGPPLARDRPRRPDRARQPRAPRRGRLRGQHRGRGRDPLGHPPPVPARVARDAGIALPEPASASRGLPPRDGPSRAGPASVRGGLAGEGLRLLGWRASPRTRPDSAIGAPPAGHRPGVHRPPDDLAAATTRTSPSSAGSTSPAGSSRRRSAAARSPAGRRLHPLDVVPHDRLQGDAQRPELLTFYPDLLDERFESALGPRPLALLDQHLPAWSRAHPYRYISHNGEINTLRGNVNWMFARQSTFRSRIFGEDLNKIRRRSTWTGRTRRSSTTCWSCCTSRAEPGPHDDDDGPRAGAATRACASAARSTSTTRASWSRGTGPRRSPSRTASGSAPRSTATASARALLGHPGRPRRHGVRGRSPRHPARGRRREGPPPAGPHVLVDTEQGRIIPDDELKAAIRRPALRQWVAESLVNLADLPAPRA